MLEKSFTFVAVLRKKTTKNVYYVTYLRIGGNRK